jgi:uncharacterized protein YcfJ
MIRFSMVAACMSLLLTHGAARAVDGDAVLGGAIGGAAGAAIGSEIGGRTGAIAGGAAGAAIGTAIATDKDDDDHRHRDAYHEGYDRHGPPPHAYAPPPGHVKHRNKRRGHH